MYYLKKKIENSLSKESLCSIIRKISYASPNLISLIDKYILINKSK